jgi:hypothetical protein
LFDSHRLVVQSTKSCTVGYVPDGMSPEQYKKLKEKENAKNKNLGAYGPQSFKSRSMISFQKDLEAGKASHLMPVFNAQEKLKKGLLKKEDIPYMQRLGSWDGSDVGQKKKWRDDDKSYNANVKESTVDWSGKRKTSGPIQKNAQTNQQTPAPKKKLFGLF